MYIHIYIYIYIYIYEYVYNTADRIFLNWLSPRTAYTIFEVLSPLHPHTHTGPIHEHSHRPRGHELAHAVQSTSYLIATSLAYVVFICLFFGKKIVFFPTQALATNWHAPSTLYTVPHRHFSSHTGIHLIGLFCLIIGLFCLIIGLLSSFIAYRHPLSDSAHVM